MSADLVIHRTPEIASLPVPTNIGDIERYASLFAKSGYFNDAREMAQAAVKIIAGAECGLKPFAAMNGIYIVKGRTSMSANVLATLVKTSGRYNYKVTEITAERCSIDFYENGQLCGPSEFTIKDARLAGTQNVDKFARNMLFARALSNGVRWYCPDVTAGPMYTPEELGAEVDGEGEVVRRGVTVAASERVQPQAEQPEEESLRRFDIQPGESEESWTKRVNDAMKAKVSEFGMRGPTAVCVILTGKERDQITYADFADCLEMPAEKWQAAKDTYFPAKQQDQPAESPPLATEPTPAEAQATIGAMSR